MFNFKAIALSGLIALSTFGGVAVQAAPSSCAFRENHSYGQATEVFCDVHERTNANGHTVYDVTFFEDGKQMTLSVVLWTQKGNPAYAEVFAQGERATTSWFYAKNGAIGLYGSSGKTIYFFI